MAKYSNVPCHGVAKSVRGMQGGGRGTYGVIFELLLPIGYLYPLDQALFGQRYLTGRRRSVRHEGVVEVVQEADNG